MWPMTFDQEWPDVSRDKSEFTRLLFIVDKTALHQVVRYKQVPLYTVIHDNHYVCL